MIANKVLPQFCIPNRPIKSVKGVIIHYFSAINVLPDDPYNLQECRNLMIDLNRDRADREHYMLGGKWPVHRMQASAHIFIGRKGEVWKLVDFDQEAYHAGPSMLNNRIKCNEWTLGIELIGDQHSRFSREQYTALVDVLIDIERRYNISRRNVAGHDSVRYAAIQANPDKGYRYKYDPSGRKDGQGNNFDWHYLGKLWNDRVINPEGVNSIKDLDAVLQADPLSS